MFSTPEGTHPLLAAQAGLWYERVAYSEPPSHNVGDLVRITGTLDAALLAHCICLAVNECEAFRTHFIDTEDGPRQLFSSKRYYETEILEVFDFRQTTDSEGRLAAAVDAAARKPISLSEGRPFRSVLFFLPNNECAWLHLYNHIIIDGYGYGLIGRRVAEIYTSLEAGQRIPASAFQNIDTLIESEKRYFESTEFTDDEIFWERYLGVLPPPTRLGPASERYSTFPNSLSSTISIDTSKRIQNLARTLETTPARLLIALTVAFIHRLSGVSDICFGLPISNRHPSALNIPSMMSSTLPVRIEISPNLSLQDIVTRIGNRLTEVLAHRRYPASKLILNLRKKRGQMTDFGPIINALPFKQELYFGSKKGVLHNASTRTTADVSFSFFLDFENGIDFYCTANSYVHSSSDVRKISKRLILFIEQICEYPSSPIGQFNTLEDQSVHPNSSSSNHTLENLNDLSLISCFENRAASSPHSCALRWQGGSLTYASLNEKSNQLAHYLIAHQVRLETVVAILLPRSPELIIAVLAIFKVGGAYLPLDVEYPQQRLRFMIADAKPALILTLKSHLAVAGSEVTKICLDSKDVLDDLAARPKCNPGCSNRDKSSLHSLAYILYTSGSTGKPKGVAGVHSTLINRLRWDIEEAAPNTAYVQRTTPNFIDFVWEVFSPLSAGHTVCVAPLSSNRDVRELIRFLSRNAIQRIVLVPSLLQAILDEEPNLRSVVPHLRYWSCGGEALSPSLYAQFRKTLPEALLINLYGTSEFWDAAGWRGSEQYDQHHPSVPLGRSLPGVRIYVLDDCLQPLPVGITGEIYIAGAGLARGYLGKPGLTAGRFVADPIAADGSRMYRTGDLGYWDQEGLLGYKGRADHQIKVRGFRVELSEIEHQLRELPQVEDACVVPFTAPSGATVLTAYVVANSSIAIQPPPSFGLFYFADSQSPAQKDIYRLLFEGAKFADSHNFSAVWTPERHFTEVAASFPNPSVLSAALAVTTERISLRAGSVVLPLHHPIRVAEEWSVVDNLSGGRAGIAVASGWIPSDFVFSPSAYEDRFALTIHKLSQVRALWRGETISFEAGAGTTNEVRLRPAPIQSELPVWITATRSQSTFEAAGRCGANVLTALLSMTRQELADNIQVYREARRSVGLDPSTGSVALMLHTFVSANDEDARQIALEPIIAYFDSHTELRKQVFGQIEGFSENVALMDVAKDQLVLAAVTRFFSNSSLIGGPDSCLKTVKDLASIGVNEFACLVDFGIDEVAVLESLHHLNSLREMAQTISLVDEKSIKASLLEKLPDHMVPSMVFQLDRLPLTPNGKIDRLALPAPTFGQISKRLLTESEQSIADLFSEVLGVQDIDANSNFFDLGGHSLLATRLINRIRAKLSVDLPISALFEAPTVEQLSSRLHSGNISTRTTLRALRRSSQIPANPGRYQNDA